MSTEYFSESELQVKKIIDKLRYDEELLSKSQFIQLISCDSTTVSEYLFECAREVRSRVYDNHVYIRGLIEFTNICKSNCLYCGIRRDNILADRYRLTKEEILECCKTGYDMGFRTFVLQGGEDGHFTDDLMMSIIASIRSLYPDCAITLSMGEKSYDTYKAFFEAGANRYLLRHETSNEEHYKKLHPKELSIKKRKQCLFDLKEIGYQVGTGFMVGSPWQTPECIAEDLLFIAELRPQMVGIGPFIPHKDTPFAGKKAGTARQTLFILALLRLMIPELLLPATTALGTVECDGREKGIMAGANVVMPNLSPISVRKKYLLYDNKLFTGAESAESLDKLKKRIEAIGYEIVVGRGDSKCV